MEKEIKRTIRVIPDTSNAPRRLYSNLVFVNSTKHDFTLTFSDFILPLDHEMDPDSEEQLVLAPVIARIGLSADLIPDFIKALEQALANYEKQWGPKGK
jgi:hypothetical protein